MLMQCVTVVFIVRLILVQQIYQAFCYWPNWFNFNHRDLIRVITCFLKLEKKTNNNKQNPSGNICFCKWNFQMLSWEALGRAEAGVQQNKFHNFTKTKNINCIFHNIVQWSKHTSELTLKNYVNNIRAY